MRGGFREADPDVELEWSRLEGRRWTRTCVCGNESWYEPEPERRRLDPLDPSTAFHLGLGACGFRETTDRVILVASAAILVQA